MNTWLDDTEDAAGEEELTDFTFGGKDAIIFLIDASPSMHEKNDSEGEEESEGGLSMALKCVASCLRSKVFNAPTDLVGVLLYGTKNQVDCRDFKNLSVLLPLETAEASSILKVEELTEQPDKFDKEFGQSKDFSLHEALWQCQSLFANATGQLIQS